MRKSQKFNRSKLASVRDDSLLIRSLSFSLFHVKLDTVLCQWLDEKRNPYCIQWFKVLCNSTIIQLLDYALSFFFFLNHLVLNLNYYFKSSLSYCPFLASHLVFLFGISLSFPMFLSLSTHSYIQLLTHPGLLQILVCRCLSCIWGYNHFEFLEYIVYSFDFLKNHSIFE